jgi:hypothetical protein
MESTIKIIPLGDPSLKKESVIFTVEPAAKELIDNIVHRGESYVMKSKNGDREVEFDQKYDNYPEVPKTIGGVVLHYVLKGIKEDMGIEFDEKPYALRERSGTTTRSSSRLLSVKAKNELLEKCSSLYWEDQDLDEEEVMEKVMDSMKKVKEWKEKGYYLPKEKNQGIMLIDSGEYKNYLAEKDRIKSDRQKRGEALGASKKAS